VYRCTPEGLRLQIRQVRRWLRAARQDADPGIRFLHASYGIGALDLVRQMADDAEVRRATGADPLHLLEELSAVQDAAQRALEAGRGSDRP
jgi:hypothetical protein